MLGRSANFGTTSDDTDASYWLNKFADGTLTKGDFERDVKLSSEFDKREDLKEAYVASGRAATEQELDAIMGTDSAANTVNKQFLDDYASKITAGDDTVELDSRVTGDANQNFIDKSNLKVGDLKASTTQGDTTSTVDQAIRDAYRNVLGREADEEGYNYWAKQLRDNPTFNLAASFKEQVEYKNKNP